MSLKPGVEQLAGRSRFSLSFDSATQLEPLKVIARRLRSLSRRCRESVLGWHGGAPVVSMRLA
eukprot:5147229-Pyramimonas_sp.AAC.1